MSSPASVSLMPDQVAALHGLVNETGAFGVDVAADTYLGIRVVTFATQPGHDEDEDVAPIVRFWSIGVAGTIREQSLLDADEARVAA